MVYTRIIVVSALTVLAQVKSELLYRGTSDDGTYAEVRRLDLPGGAAKTVTTYTSQRILGAPQQIVKSEISSSAGSHVGGDLSNRFLGLDNLAFPSLGSLPLAPKPIFNPLFPQQQPFGLNPFGNLYSPLLPTAFPQNAVPGIPQLPQSFGNVPSINDYFGGGSPLLGLNPQDQLSLISSRSLPSAKQSEENKEAH